MENDFLLAMKRLIWEKLHIDFNYYENAQYKDGSFIQCSHLATFVDNPNRRNGGYYITITDYCVIYSLNHNFNFNITNPEFDPEDIIKLLKRLMGDPEPARRQP